ncbi:OmpA family protein [Phormidium sp. LEGE 05292]|uniref:OmpA family protein n=1 Tax=[Phormidium] sp. LEGE 05292 TaxID=767427 RepID=UPI00187EF4EA|nr:OmpA family protein [Phormidium sp. LEGE 05292]MBE9229165.1 OmpA family protein [Phormidium sp. LEGE 05292]
MGRFFLVFLFRFLLLVVGGGFAALLGVALATVYPASIPEKPLVTKIPEILPGMDANDNSNNPNVAVQSDTKPLLTTAQRKQLERELQRLERQLKTRGSSPKLEARIKAIRQQLRINLAKLPTASQLALSTEPLVNPDTLAGKIPADVLFEDNQTYLLTEGKPVLDKLVDELKKYPGAAVVIGVHTDSVGEVSNNRALSFRQAEAIAQYLSSTLGKSYTWIPVGYGEISPLVNDENQTNLQFNRRVEIKVNPQ